MHDSERNQDSKRNTDSEREIDLESIGTLISRAKGKPEFAPDQSARNEICLQVQEYLEKMAAKYLDDNLRRKVDPADVVQQTMARMINGFEGFRGKSTTEFYGWLTTILRNEIRSCRRDWHRSKRDVLREQDLNTLSGTFTGPEPADPQPTPGSEALKAERLKQLERVMQRLPEDMSMVIRLRTLQSLPFKDVAEKMGRSYDAVTKLWYRAIMKFQKELNADDETPSENS